MRDGDHSQNGGTGSQADGARTMLCGRNNSGIACHSLSKIAVNLANQYDGVTNDHASERNHAKQSDKSHWCSARQHSQHDTR